MPYKKECELCRVINSNKIEKWIYKDKAKNDSQYDKQTGILHDNIVSELNYRMKFSQNDIVLDAGCGRGGLTKRVKKYVKSVIGIDLSKTSLKEFNDAIIPRIQCDVVNLPFCNNYFDKIYSYSVAEYFPNIDYFRQFLSEQFRVLKRGGILYIAGIFNGYLEDEYKLAQKPSAVKNVLSRLYRKFIKIWGIVTKKEKSFFQFDFLYIRPDIFHNMLDKKKFEFYPYLSTVKNQPEHILKFRYDVMIIKKG